MFPGAIVFRFGTHVFSLYQGIHLLAFAVSMVLILAFAKREKLPFTETAAYLFLGVFVAIVGSKLYRLAEAAIRGGPLTAETPDSWLKLPAGSSFYGALLAGILFSLWYLKRFRLPLWKVADIAAAGTVLGFAVARLGCFLSGCCYGRPSSLPWAVHIPGLPGPVHPTQLYESTANLALFLVLVRMLMRKRFDGQVVAWDAVLNSGIRFVVEYYRGDPGRGYLIRGASPLSSLSVPQALALLGIAAGITIFLIRGRKPDVGAA
jgi:phosphatidylglycerol:prolipoprotein diacylglycerol transferase